jgi:hypothetical protein
LYNKVTSGATAHHHHAPAAAPASSSSGAPPTSGMLKAQPALLEASPTTTQLLQHSAKQPAYRHHNTLSEGSHEGTQVTVVLHVHTCTVLTLCMMAAWQPDPCRPLPSIGQQ